MSVKPLSKEEKEKEEKKTGKIVEQVVKTVALGKLFGYAK